MTLDYSRLRSLTAREIIGGLLRDGFSMHRQTGSHRQYRHPDGRRVTVTFHHSSSTFPLPTLKAMIDEQAKWSEGDLLRLKLLR